MRYKPDFLLETGEFVEIKGTFNFDQDLPKIRQFESDYNVKVLILQERDLRQLIKPTPFVFEHLRQEWKSQAKVRGMHSFGERNPMYGVTQTESTKAKIAEKAKARFQDPVFREKFINSEKKKRYHESRRGVKIGSSVEKVSLICQFCGTVYQVMPFMANRKDKKYCSYPCSINAQHGKTATTETEIRRAAIDFALQHADELFTVRLNQLKPLFQPLYDSIAQKHGIIDIRTICHSVTGKPSSRKELLFYLKTSVENVRGAIANQEAIEPEDKKPLG